MFLSLLIDNVYDVADNCIHILNRTHNVSYEESPLYCLCTCPIAKIRFYLIQKIYRDNVNDFRCFTKFLSCLVLKNVDYIS